MKMKLAMIVDENSGQEIIQTLTKFLRREKNNTTGEKQMRIRQGTSMEVMQENPNDRNQCTHI